MVKKICLSLLLIFSIIVIQSQVTTVEVEASSKVTLKAVTGKQSLVVRAKASSNSKKLIEVSKDLVVQVVGTSGKWSKIKYGKTTGFVPTANLKSISPTQGKLKNSGKVSVKNTPTKNGTVKGTISGGSSVTVYGVTSSWVYVMTNKVHGYIDRNKIDLAKAQITIADGYYPNKNKQYSYMGSEIGDYIIGRHYGDNAWETDTGEMFWIFPHVEVKGNKVIYSSIDSSDVYEFPMYKGKKWVHKDIYQTITYEVISISEKVTITDKRVGINETYSNVLLIKETSKSGSTSFVGYKYFAKGIGPIYAEIDGYMQYKFIGFF